MPCMCWFTPEKASHRLIKGCLQQIVDELKALDKEGDPIGLQPRDVKELFDHLMHPEKCDEMQEAIKARKRKGEQLHTHYEDE